MNERTKYLALSLGFAIVGLFFLADSRMAITGKAVEANMFFGVGSSGLGILFIFASIMLFLIAWALRDN